MQIVIDRDGAHKHAHAGASGEHPGQSQIKQQSEAGAKRAAACKFIKKQIPCPVILEHPQKQSSHDYRQQSIQKTKGTFYDLPEPESHTCRQTSCYGSQKQGRRPPFAVVFGEGQHKSHQSQHYNGENVFFTHNKILPGGRKQASCRRSLLMRINRRQRHRDGGNLRRHRICRQPHGKWRLRSLRAHPARLHR